MFPILTTPHLSTGRAVLGLSFTLLLAACRTPGDDKGVGGTIGGLDGQGDGDGDGYLAAEDCNDADAAVNAGAVEVCDGIDNDCDGQIDEEVGETYYPDLDGDGFGDPSAAMEACEAPEGAVPNGSDCDDSNSDIYPEAPERCDELDNDCDATVDEDLTLVWYPDNDRDTYGNSDAPLDDCDPPDGYVAEGGDCADEDDTAFPGNPEVCDEVDNDCNGEVDEGITETWYADRDGDGYGVFGETVEACSPPIGYASLSGDCDDDLDTVNPAATELCNTRDDDCDGDIDEDSASDAQTWWQDADSDGYGDPLSSTLACAAPAGFVDNDGDCDDAQTAVNPAATEICNTWDDDCDGLREDLDPSVDTRTGAISYRDADADGYGAAAAASWSCSLPSGNVTNALDCDDANNTVNPLATEVCNSRDDDCDTLVDDADSSLDSATGSLYYRDTDLDGYGSPTSPYRTCLAPSGAVTNALDCDDTRNAVNPAASEVCNGLDDDCDAATDDADTSVDLSTGGLYYPDGDGDTYGALTGSLRACNLPSGYVSRSLDCNDGNGAINPGATEICNSVDDDCDALTDAADSGLSGGVLVYTDSDRDGYGAGSVSRACSVTTGTSTTAGDCNDSSAAINPLAAEICNSLDDDCDGFTDDADPGRIGGTTYYRDADGDTYGTSATTITACSASSGYVSRAGDCNDGSSSIRPGASEICDGADQDCDGDADDGVLGTGASCPAVDCAEILLDNPARSSGNYTLFAGTYYCQMTKDGGGWTRIGNNVAVWGTGWDTTAYNSGPRFTWDELLVEYASGSAHAHCTYPESLTGCNNLGLSFNGSGWYGPLNWGSSTCGMPVTDLGSATSYIGGYDFKISLSASTATVQIGALEGISSCTTGDNPGTAYLNLYVR